MVPTTQLSNATWVDFYRESRMLNYDIRTQRASDRATPLLGMRATGGITGR